VILAKITCVCKSFFQDCPLKNEGGPYLKHFPIDQLKIDKSFIQNINTDESDQVIVGAILAIARQMRFELIAEGVETVEQFNYLISKGCTNFQGFYFNVPLPAYEFCEQYIQ